MAHPAFVTFLDRMDHLVATENDPHAIANSTGYHLAELLAEPGFLAEQHRRADTEAYAQHVVHVHPQGKYSVVALVWLPGQTTPIHNHICWCVVGVLQGQEREISYELAGDDQEQWLEVRNEQLYPAGDVCCLVPPFGDIHRVENPSDGVSISIHVYGADIGVLGSSINKRYSCEVRSSSAA